jgi:hypothetical protein
MTNKEDAVEALVFDHPSGSDDSLCPVQWIRGQRHNVGFTGMSFCLMQAFILPNSLYLGR